VPPTETVPPAAGTEQSNGHGPLAPVIPLAAAPGSRQRSRPSAALGWLAVLVALGLAVSPLFSGYFNAGLWEPLALAAIVLLVVIARATRQPLGRAGMTAGAALATLLALSALSILWAESKDSAWTDTNRLALYVVLFAIALLAVRDRRTGRAIMLLLGSAALVASAVLAVVFLAGGGQGAFLSRRLNDPIGYVNGTAGLLVMGIWPWLAYAETASRRVHRSAALTGAALIAGMFMLTQSRAVIPATVLSAVLVLLCAPGRTRRAVGLLLVAAAVAVALPWTLAVYSHGGSAARNLPPAHGLLRGASLAMLLAAVAVGAIHYGLERLAARVEPRRRATASRRLGTVLLVAVLAATAIGVGVGGPWISRQYRAFTALHVNQSASVRFVDAGGFRYDLWRVAVREFRSHPLGGIGAGNYDADYYRLRNNPEYVVQPHSVELQMAAELGIFGLLALLVFCGTVLRGGFGRRRTLAAEDPLIRIAALGMFAAWLADTSVDWLYDIPGLTGMAIVAAALLVAPAPGGAGARPRAAVRRSRAGQLGLVAGLCVIALLAASIGRQYAASRYQTAGAHEIARSPGNAIGTLREAAKLDPYALTTLYSLSSAYARLDDYGHARDALLLAAGREPHNYVPPALLGDLATRRGDYATAVADYRRSLALNPRDVTLKQSVANAAKLVRGR
jgi:hypothetical protein